MDMQGIQTFLTTTATELGVKVLAAIAVMLNIALVLGILGCFGIQTTSFAVLIAGAAVVIGVALVPHRPLLAGVLRHQRGPLAT